ncbi:unnamed protein product [Calypogeia fissa]
MTAGEEPATAQAGKRAEGWLYLIAARRLRGQYPQKRYFILEGGVASCYRTKPVDGEQVPIRKGVIDPYTRVTDNGRETIHSQVLFVFTVYDSTDNENQLKFGARSAEEAAKWMTAFKAAAEQAHTKGKNGAFVSSHGRRRLPFRKRGGSGLISYPSCGQDSFQTEEAAAVPDWTGALSFKDGSPDVVATSPWRIIGCKNGLRLFMETTDQPGFGLKNMLFKEDQPALMAVGVVNASCEAIFETAMALGPSRHEWDFCYLRGKVIEHIDGHTDIIHKQFHTNWMPWRMKPRDLVLLRYWRREDDGSYVILYRSVKHDKCPPRRGFVRAKLKSGGYVIAPLGPQGPQSRSLVRHMITADWKVWQTCFQPSSEQDVTLRVLERIAAIREVYKARSTGMLRVSDSLKSLSDAATSNGVAASIQQGKKVDEATSGAQKSLEGLDSQDGVGTADRTFLQLGDGDEFYDVQEEAAWWDSAEGGGSLRHPKEAVGTLDDDDDEKHKDCKSPRVPKFSAAATIVKRLHELANTVKKNQPESGINEIEAETFSKEGSLAKSSENIPSSCWDNADVDTFLIRGKKYLQDNLKVKAEEPWMQFIAADWLKSDKREDHLACRPSNIVQILTTRFERNSSKSRVPYFFIINLQVPGAITHSLSLYYMTFKRLDEDPLLEKFVHGDDRFRNSRFKLIPHIAKGSWIVKQSVGKTACLIGQALTIDYHTGSNYIELDVDIGSSSVAKGVVNLVLGYLSKLVIEMAFLIQADTDEELPEHLLGTCRLNYLDINKAVAAAD